MTLSAIGLLVGFGLCGVGGALMDRNNLAFVYDLGIGLFWLSALGLVIAFVWAAFKGFIESGRPRR